MTDLVSRLQHLVALNEPRLGGPYQGAAAVECVKAMTEAAEALRTLDMLLSAEDVWADYGDGFRLHFSFARGAGDMAVVEKINTARAKLKQANA